jgi:hypothetical protein
MDVHSYQERPNKRYVEADSDVFVEIAESEGVAWI